MTVALQALLLIVLLLMLYIGYVYVIKPGSGSLLNRIKLFIYGHPPKVYVYDQDYTSTVTGSVKDETRRIIDNYHKVEKAFETQQPYPEETPVVDLPSPSFVHTIPA